VVCAIPIDDDHRNVKVRGHKSLGLASMVYCELAIDFGISVTVRALWLSGKILTFKELPIFNHRIVWQLSIGAD
jgi:hypothetical protein